MRTHHVSHNSAEFLSFYLVAQAQGRGHGGVEDADGKAVDRGRPQRTPETEEVARCLTLSAFELDDAWGTAGGYSIWPRTATCPPRAITLARA